MKHSSVHSNRLPCSIGANRVTVFSGNMSLLLWSLYHSNLEITFNFSPVLASGFDSNLKWKPMKSPSKLKSFNIWHLFECFKRLKYLILPGSQSMCNSNHCKIWEICQEPFKSSLRGFQCAKWEKKVTPTEKVMQYAHCLNWRPSEWKTDDGEEEDKNKSWLYNEIEFVNLHSLSIPVPESDCFHSMALTRVTIYSIVLCICRKLLQLMQFQPIPFSFEMSIADETRIFCNHPIQ